MSESLKQQTFKGIVWSAVERFAVQGVTFMVQLILARLLTPDDFGVVGMLAIFIQISQVFIDSGFANALIKKQDCQDKDFSTVFYYNLAVSIILYVILYAISPLIADFYSTEAISNVLRVLSLVLIFNALSIVQRTILVKKVDFKSQSKVTLLSSIISGILGIYLAYSGYNVWALVAQQLSNSILQMLLYIKVVKWIPSLIFSKKSFLFVFNYGSKLLVASIISAIYNNMYAIVIGKKFTAYDLGIYTRAESFVRFPSSNIAAIINRVAFPIMGKLQDNNLRLVDCYKKIIQYSSFIIFPLMCGLIAVAKPFVLFFLTERWIDVVPILQILSVSYMFDHLCSINLNLLYVTGRTDLVLKLEVIKKTIAIIILLSTISWGIKVMCFGIILYNLIAVYLNSHYTKTLFNYGWLKQLNDYIPFLIASIVMMCCVFITTSLFSLPLIKLLIGIAVGIAIYVILSITFFRIKVKEILYLMTSRK